MSSTFIIYYIMLFFYNGTSKHKVVLEKILNPLHGEEIHGVQVNSQCIKDAFSVYFLVEIENLLKSLL
jgi:hypothetical protein